MISLRKRSETLSRLGIVLLSLGAICACSTPAPSPREELVGMLGGANVDAYHLTTSEDDTQVITALTNSALRSTVNLDGGDTNVVLRYASVRDKKANTTKVYKAEVTKTGSDLTLLVADLNTNEAVTRTTFPPPEPHAEGGPTFDSLEACIADFNCQRKGPLQCEANRTCQAQFAGLTCCLTSGQCFSVHLVIPPTSLRCQLVSLVPDLEGLVFTQQ